MQSDHSAFLDERVGCRSRIVEKRRKELQQGIIGNVGKIFPFVQASDQLSVSWRLLVIHSNFSPTRPFRACLRRAL